jgi:hypothetical protein
MKSEMKTEREMKSEKEMKSEGEMKVREKTVAKPVRDDLFYLNISLLPVVGYDLQVKKRSERDFMS